MNIQHRNSNVSHPMSYQGAESWMFEVRCWLLDVSLIIYD